MTARSVFNAAADVVVSVPVWGWKLVALGTAIFVALILIRAHDTGLLDDGKQVVRDSLSAATALRLHRQKDSIGKRVDTVSVAVTRTVHRVDSLWMQLPESLVTRADTIKALQSLPDLRVASAAASASCMELSPLVLRYRTTCDSLDDARQHEIAGLKRQLASVKPRIGFKSGVAVGVVAVLAVLHFVK